MQTKNTTKIIKKSARIKHRALKRSFIADIRRIIDETRAAVVVTVNAGMTTAYWRIGKRIKVEILKGQRVLNRIAF
jgi:hypothetical protein